TSDSTPARAASESSSEDSRRTPALTPVRSRWPARPSTAPRRRRNTGVSSLLGEPDDLDLFEHPNRPRAALVVRRDDAKRPLIVEERLPVDRVGDDDVVGGEAGVELGQ